MAKKRSPAFTFFFTKKTRATGGWITSFEESILLQLDTILRTVTAGIYTALGDQKPLYVPISWAPQIFYCTRTEGFSLTNSTRPRVKLTAPPRPVQCPVIQQVVQLSSIGHPQDPIYQGTSPLNLYPCLFTCQQNYLPHWLPVIPFHHWAREGMPHTASAKCTYSVFPALLKLALLYTPPNSRAHSSGAQELNKRYLAIIHEN